MFFAFRPKLDSIGERIHGLVMASNERASEVNVLEVVFFGMQVCDLANIITAERKRQPI